MSYILKFHKDAKSKKSRLDFKKLSDVSSEDECPAFELQNVVATFNLGVKHLNLRKISLEKPFIEYNPSKFAAATLRFAFASYNGIGICIGEYGGDGCQDRTYESFGISQIRVGLAKAWDSCMFFKI